MRQKMNFNVFVIFLFCLFLSSCGENVKKKTFELPQEKWSPFYENVLEQNLVPNSKIWANAKPTVPKEAILAYYDSQQSRPGFSLKLFLDTAFVLDLPKKSIQNIPFEKYIETYFLSLIKKATDDGGSMLPTRKNMMTGGDSFQEFSYANGFFVYKGLEAVGREDLCEELMLNYMQFIQDYGHVPAANRTYKLDFSELPVLVMLVDAHSKKHPEKLTDYISLLTREYQYWIAAENKEAIAQQEKNKVNGAFRSVVFMGKNDILNRYFAGDSSRRADNYLLDKNLSKPQIANLRANDMAGYAINGRWAEYQTSNMLPVDLNALLYKTETLLAKAYSQAKQNNYAVSFSNLAQKRKLIYNKIFWKENAYYDYDYVRNANSTSLTLASIWPVYVGLADEKQTEAFLKTIQSKLVSNSLFKSGTEDEHISVELNYLVYLLAQKTGKVALSDQIRTNLLKISRENYAINKQIQGYFPDKYARIDGALGALIALNPNYALE